MAHGLISIILEHFSNNYFILSRLISQCSIKTCMFDKEIQSLIKNSDPFSSKSSIIGCYINLSRSLYACKDF